MTDEQFTKAYRRVGLWFFLTRFETIYNWHADKRSLIDLLFKESNDKNPGVIRTRLTYMQQIIEAGRAADVLTVIKESKRMHTNHPESEEMAEALLQKYFS